MINTVELERDLGYTFQDRQLLYLALTHPSLAHEAGVGHQQQHNQRLEFLGDAVLQLVLTAELYHRFSAQGEGPLTQARAQLVNRASLAGHGVELKLGQYLILSRGEETTGGRHRHSTLADAFEAIVGAIYLDAGYDRTRELILRLFASSFGELAELPNLDNPKGELQELLQTSSPEPPRYGLISVSGPDHNRQFESVVLHDGNELGRGRGRSKKLAESAAAAEALRRLKEPTAASLPPTA
jgi:ribonuclease III